MRMTVVNATNPGSEPLSLDELRAHCRIDGTTEDDVLLSCLLAARQNLDGPNGWLGRALITQTIDMYMDAFGGDTIHLPLPPLQSVTHVKYYDTAGTLQTYSSANYTVDTDSEPGRIVLGESAPWPSTDDRPNAVNIRYVAGYGTREDIPEPIRMGLKLMVEGMYSYRGSMGAGITLSDNPVLDRLLMPYRIRVLGCD